MMGINGFPKYRKFFFIIPFILISIFLIFAASQRQKPQSKFTIVPQENNFRLAFDIAKKDEGALTRFLEKLNLPQSTIQGVTFQLDSTSSAKLAFASPIKTNVTFSQNSLSFQGNLQRDLKGYDFAFENIKIPKSTKIAVLSMDFKNFLDKNLSPPQEFRNWLDKNVKSENGSYFVISGENDDFALVFKNPSLDLEGLKNLKDPEGQPISKEDEVEGASFNLVKTQLQNGDEKTLSIFSKNGWNLITSSSGSAKDFLQAFDSNDSIDFPDLSKREKVSYVVYYFGSSQPGVIAAYFANTDSFEKTLEKIESFKFILSTSSFSGLINLK